MVELLPCPAPRRRSRQPPLDRLRMTRSRSRMGRTPRRVSCTAGLSCRQASGRRRLIDPATCDAITRPRWSSCSHARVQKAQRTPVPDLERVLEVLHGLGYQKAAGLRNAGCVLALTPPDRGFSGRSRHRPVRHGSRLTPREGRVLSSRLGTVRSRGDSGRSLAADLSLIRADPRSRSASSMPTT